MTVELDPQGDNFFSHFSSCVFHNGTHCAGNMSSLPCQSENPAYLAHLLGTFEDEDEDGKLLVRPTTRRESLEEGRDQNHRRLCTSGSFETS